jgi:hypothetical protein
MAHFFSVVIGLSVFSIFISPQLSDAATRTLTSSGRVVKWKDRFKFELRGNSQNSSGLTSGDLMREITQAMDRWRFAARDAFEFKFSLGQDAEAFRAKSEYDQGSYLYFVSQSPGGAESLGRGVLALTQTWYHTETGEILEADVALNDRDFKFTLDPKDHAGSWGGTGRALQYSDRPKIYLPNVLTHEFGHAIGMAHAQHLEATMLYMEGPDQNHLSCDDQSGVRSLYPLPGANSGAVRGQVLSSLGVPLFAAVVKVIDQRQGRVQAGGLTDERGYFQIEQIPHGEYTLTVNELKASGERSSLPQFYQARLASLKVNTCESTGEEGLRLQVLKARQMVSDSGLQDLGTFTLHCGREPEANALVANTPLLSQGPPGLDEVRTFDLSALHGKIVISALSYSLGSPVDLTAEIVRPNDPSLGSTQEKATISYRYEDQVSGMKLRDLRIEAELPEGEHSARLRLTIRPIQAAGADVPPAVLMERNFADVLLIAVPSDGLPTESGKCRQLDRVVGASDPTSGAGSGSSGSESGSKPTLGCGRVSSSGEGSEDLKSNFLMMLGLMAFGYLWVRHQRSSWVH